MSSSLLRAGIFVCLTFVPVLNTLSQTQCVPKCICSVVSGEKIKCPSKAMTLRNRHTALLIINQINTLLEKILATGDVRFLLPGIGEITRWLRACISLAEDLSSVPRTHMGQITAPHSCISSVFNNLFWSLQVPVLMCVCICVCLHTHMHTLKNNKK